MTHLRLAPTLAAVAVLLAACGGPSEKEMLDEARAALAKDDRATAVIRIKSAIQKNPESGEARYLLGKTLLDGGEATNAAVELSKARSLKYSEAKVAPALAKALLMTGEHRKVIEQFNDLVLDDPEAQAELKTVVAQALAASGDVELAKQMLAAALRAQPTHPGAQLLEARLKAAEGDVDGALAIVDGVIARHPGREEAQSLKGDLLAFGKRDREGAVKAWRAALDKQPKLVSAHREIVVSLLGNKDIDGATAQVEAMKKVLPNHPETRFLAAQIAFYRKDFAAVREQLDLVLKVRPDDPLALQLSGVADFELQSYTTAENSLARALKANGNLVLARETLAQLYIRTRQPTKAIELLQPMVNAPNPPARLVALLAEAYSRAGDKKRADELFARAVKSDPDNVPVRTAAAMKQAERGDDKAMAELEQLSAADKGLRPDIAMVRAQLARRNVDGALKAADAIVRKAPDRAIGHLLRGRLLADKQDFAGATTSLEKAVSIDPANLAAVSTLAAIDLRQNQPERARKRFDDLLAKDPKNARAMVALAELKLRTGAPSAEVSATLQQAVKTDPALARARVALINHHLARGETQAALNSARDASAALPASLEVMDAVGVAQLRGGDTQQAISTFKKLAALQPSAPAPQMRLGDAYLASRDPDNAALAFKRALELKDDLLPAQRALADIANAARRPQDALTIARQVQQQRPAEGAGWLIEGDTEATRKSWDAALAAYRTALNKTKTTDTAVRIYRVHIAADKAAEAERFAATWMGEHPNDFGFLYAQGDVALARGQLASAESFYRAVLKLSPEHGLAHNNVAWLMQKQGKPGALAHAEKASTLVPDQPAVLDTLALVLLAEGQTAKALEVQKRAVERAPDAPTLRLTLARIYLKSGDKIQAKTELDKLARLGSKFPQQDEVAELLKSV